MSPSDGVGSRREARERALSLLYEVEVKDRPAGEVLDALPLEPVAFAVDLVRGVGRCRAEIDEVIRRYSRAWPLERMPVVDRTLLRMAVYELGHRLDVPTGAILSEAVELATRYSTDDSARFVNGMLSRISEELRPEAPRSAPEPQG
ncbi:MAG: transcription antitermination factor NusB [Acidimicrobiales bacterium]